MKNLLILLAFAIANLANADIVGVRISGGVFDYEVSGTIMDGDGTDVARDTINVKSELGLQDDSDSQVYIYIEHPVPILPNIRFGSTSLKLAGTGTIAAGGFWFNGTDFTALAGQSITSSFDMSHTEIALYYEIIDTGIDFDLGLNFKFFDGDVSIASSGASATEKFDGTVPMLYAALTIPLPAGFSIAGDISTISAGDAAFTDYLIRLRYETDFVLGLELGYRSITLDFEDTGANELVDIEVSGPYVSLHLAF